MERRLQVKPEVVTLSVVVAEVLREIPVNGLHVLGQRIEALALNANQCI